MSFATSARAAVLALSTIGVIVVCSAPRAAFGAGTGIDDEKEARRLFQSAELEFNVGKFPEALADYQSAYEAKPLPGLLFNIAQCYRNMGNFERARFFFRRYLALEPRAPNRHRVDELIAEMSRQLEATQAEVAGAAAAPATTPPPADAKPIDVTPPPPVPVTSIVEPTTSTAAPSAVLVTAPAAQPAHRPVWRRWWFWTGVAAVVAGGVVAAYVLTRPSTQTPGSLAPIDGR
ncbi:MAG TPA: tetratricopeptide repeat protein [Polyangia bacterium]|nr:tetratricopeptide repeat protein [Polyangia bacterium]